MATRRSSRLKQPPPPAPVLDLSDEDEAPAQHQDALALLLSDEEEAVASDSEDDEWTNKPRKKQKRGNKGKHKDEPSLTAFAAMPTDILAQICSHLHPIDLLRLTRVNHSFREVLTGPSSSSVWIHARREVGLPDLTVPFKTEEQYASLMWDKWCMVCDRESTAPKTDLYLRRRCCPTCSRSQYCNTSSLSTASVSTKLVEKAAATSKQLHGWMRYCFKPDGLAVVDRLTELSKNRFAAMLTGKSKGAETLESFIQKKQELHARIEEDGNKLNVWTEAFLADEMAKAVKVQEEKCEKRRTDIQAKLVAQGWDPVDFADQQFALNDNVYDAKKLTKKEWERIEGDVTAILTVIRDDRLLREAEDRKYRRQDQLQIFYERHQAAQSSPTSQYVCPTYEAFLELPSVTPLWVEDVPLDDARFAATTPAIDADIAPIRIHIINTLYSRVISARTIARCCLSPGSSALGAISAEKFGPVFHSPSMDTKERLLSLSTSLLHCEACDHHNGVWPQFVSHACDRDDDDEAWGNAVEAPLRVEARRLAVLWSILAAMGTREDQVASLAELDQVGSRFICCKCEEENPTSACKYDWRWMVEHVVAAHAGGTYTPIPSIRMLRQ